MNNNFNPSDFVSWQAKNDVLVDRYIRELMKIISLDEAGNAQTTEGIKLNIYIRILMSCLQFHEVLSHERNVIHLLIYKAVFDLKKNRVQDIIQFQLLLAKEVEKYLDLPINKYIFLFPLQATGECIVDKLQVTLLGDTMQFRSWESLKAEIGIVAFLKKASDFLYKDKVSINTIFTPVLMQADGRNEEEAFDKVARKFELLRTILNMLSVQFRFKHQSGGYPTAYSEFLSAPVFGVFQPNGEFIDLFFNETKYSEYQEKKVTKEHLAGVFNIAEMLHEPTNEEDSIKIFIEALEIYGQAIDTAEWRLSFIFMWQIFELLTLKSRDNIPELLVIERVSTILDLDQFHKDMLKVLYSSRNSLIHENQFPSSNSIAMKEVGFLKMLVDQFISKSYDLILKYPTISQFSSYYQNSVPKYDKKKKQ